MKSKFLFCKRCGIILKRPHYQIQLTPETIINVCGGCFTWAGLKTTKEIKEDCKTKKQSI